MFIADPATRAKPWHLGHDEAVRIARDAADEYKVAETIYLTKNGFAITSALSPVLDRGDVGVTVTILPSGYFN